MTIVEPGYGFRAATAADLPAAARMIRDYDVEIGGHAEVNEEDLYSFVRNPRVDFARDSWLAEQDGTPVVFGLVWPNDERTIYGFGVVHPRHAGRGLGTRWLDFAERRAHEMLPPGGAYRSYVLRGDDAARELHERRGYRLVRLQYTMHRDLPATDVVGTSPVSIRNAREDEGALLHALVEDTFSEHWAHSARSFAEFSADLLERGDTDPGLWFVAEENGEPVGVLIGTFDDDGGYVVDLGVKKRARGRGIGRALLARSFAEFTRRGAAEVTLDVDAANETGAVRLYESVGMKPRNVYEIYELEIGPAEAT
ncbi:MAG TPA: GNAT family N-acetyltransferase [Actinomycetota bacterium]|jgi:mycothiol synthase|nr:GNAT family N-acetyltransferase [Actinomycetota bacterium]